MRDIVKRSVPLLLLLAALACNLPFGPGRQAAVAPPDESALEMDLTTTVTLLERGDETTPALWSLLRQLGVGVYRPDGAQVMAGSETGPGDFWLYDFELPLLEQMAVSAPQSFKLVHARAGRGGGAGS